MQENYFKKVRLERQQLLADLMAFKESETGYTTMFEEIRETCNSFNAVQNAAAIESVAMGRAKVKMDAVVYARRFSDSFKVKKYAWSILSDFANLFAHIYKRQRGISKISNSEGAPVCLELIVFSFGELGKPNFNILIGKV